MKEIIITKSDKQYIAKIDDEDFEMVNKFKWYIHPNGYANSNKNVLMHHLIIGNRFNEGLVIDHKNRDKLDNRKENLHHISNSQNAQNVQRRKNKNGLIGVYKTGSNKYSSIINDPIQDKKYHTVTVTNPDEAGKHYDILAFQLYGKHALTNQLITFEEALNYNMKEIIAKRQERDLPKNITKPGLMFVVKRKYNKRIFLKYAPTLENAIGLLNEINLEILNIQNEEKEKRLNKLITKDDYGCYILCNKGNKFYVDEKYWHKLMEYKWNINIYGYVQKKNLLLHRFIIEDLERQQILKNQVIDHINHNRLDNRIENLRIVSYSQNNHNRKKRENTSSKYIGVSADGKNWRACLTYQKKINIGSFETEKEAALAYNKKALELYGDKANINIFDE